MDRRTFLAGIAAACASPAMAKPITLPHGFFWDGDTLRLSGKTIYIDEDFVIPDVAKKVEIDNCLFHISERVTIDVRNVDSILIRDCRFHYRLDWVAHRPMKIPDNLTGIHVENDAVYTPRSLIHFKE